MASVNPLRAFSGGAHRPTRMRAQVPHPTQGVHDALVPTATRILTRHQPARQDHAEALLERRENPCPRAPARLTLARRFHSLLLSGSVFMPRPACLLAV